MENIHDFALERRLRELSPDLHKRFTDTVFALQFILSNYKLIFPEVENALHMLFSKMQNTLDVCREATNGRTGYTITQKEIAWEKI